MDADKPLTERPLPDIDAAANHANATLSLADKSIEWLTVLLAGFTSGKKMVKVRVDSLDPLTAGIWLEDKK